MSRALVIVESPAKARTIAGYLGDDYQIESSIGHIRDLPGTAAEIPPKYKKEKWARLGVNVENDFEAIYVVPREKKAQVKKLRDALREADVLYLATDEDREGEAIAWHLSEVLKPKVPVRRMVFSEITQNAIRRALDDTREIDRRLVDAQEARRVLDRLYGYEVSPVLWRKVKPRLSAGRVQSVATRLIVRRERARMRFVAAEYWGVEAELAVTDQPSQPFATRLVEVEGARVATGRDFDEATGELKKAGVVLLDESSSRRLASSIESEAFEIVDVKERPYTRRPYPPFITSTLQQEAGRKLRFTAQRTMRVAQTLYENGYITYMRTDSTQLSEQALQAAREQIRELYGTDNVPEAPRSYAKKSKNAQEAHEAIRPAGRKFRTPADVRDDLDALNSDAYRLYELIWKRTVACQMKDARGTSTTVRIDVASSEGRATFTASGKVIHFPGFLRAYVEGSDDPNAELEDQERFLPRMAVGARADARSVEASGHSTQPPARFTEASLVRELEERGIGRPSTYASIIQTIQDRGYVWKKGSALVPTFTAFAVTRLLEEHLGELVDLDFTARMESDLDSIARGDREWLPWLSDFYFGDEDDAESERGLAEMIGQGWEDIDARSVCSLPLGATEAGETVAVRVGRYGAYLQIGDGDKRVNLREDILPDELSLEMAVELVERAAGADEPIGTDPETGKPVYAKTGRFGDYVQLGDPELDDKGKIRKGKKPKMASLWPGMSRDEVTLDEALMLLSFPRLVGAHPETSEEIFAQDGRFGPYLKMGEDTRSLENHELLAAITLDQAVELFKQPKRRGRAASAVLKELGEHPQSGLKLEIKNGRFGPYVTDGEVNASVPKGRDPQTLSLEDGVELIAAREERMRAQGKDPRAKKKTKKKAKKKAAKKRTTKKRATKKKVS